jgi:hypothetical protein
MISKAYWIPGPWSGRLAIVARPRGGDWLDDEAGGWRRAGLDMVVSLLEDEEAEQLEFGGRQERFRPGELSAHLADRALAITSVRPSRGCETTQA